MSKRKATAKKSNPNNDICEFLTGKNDHGLNLNYIIIYY